MKKYKLMLVAFFSLSLLCAQAGASSHSTSHGVEEKSPVEIEAQKNLQASKQFLEQNKKNPGVVVLPSGLEYKILTEGKGPQPTEKDTVTVNYAGKLIDGKEFDSSFKRGQPSTFNLGSVISGWSEALKLMKEGATWELYIPPNLAYGENGVPPVIGPNQVLIFKVELLSVEKA